MPTSYGLDPQVLADTIKHWLALSAEDKAPKPDDMPWLTWKKKRGQTPYKINSFSSFLFFCYIPSVELNLGDLVMRTTVDIDDQLLLYAKHRAVQQGCTLKQVIEDALRNFFSHQSFQQKPVSLEIFSGTGLKPGVNLDNGRSLNDIMDGY
jgi:hypothetical protein